VKAKLHKTISLTMALLLLLSTVSWTVDKHLCMGRVMDVALFTKAEDCGMKAAMDLLEDQGIENHCCDDESFTIQGQDDLRLSWDDITIEQQSFLIAYTYSYFELYNFESKEALPKLTYPPPLLVSDIQLLDQVFLI
jgi:hypothetical protein